MKKDKIWFRSDKFKIQEGEDGYTDPGRFGKSLAEWMAQKLSEYDYEVEFVPENWGWRLMCSRSGYLLWVGCGNLVSPDLLDGAPDTLPDERDISWYVFSAIEVPFYMLHSKIKQWFGRMDLVTPLETLNHQVRTIVEADQTLRFCKEP